MFVSEHITSTFQTYFPHLIKMKSHTSIFPAIAAALFTISTCSPTPKRSNTTTSTNTTTALKYITLEEHYDSYSLRAIQNATPVYEILFEAYGASDPALIQLNQEVQDINGSRLNSMNENGIRIQVLPFLSLSQSQPSAERGNNRLSPTIPNQTPWTTLTP
jgi:hypothetical protein